MIHQKFKRDALVKPGAPRRDETLTSQVKNTTMLLTGQNCRLQAKNARLNSKTGLNLSATHAEGALGRLSPALPSWGATTQLDSSHKLKRDGENLPPRRPLKLEPLVLPKEAREAQRQKVKGIQQKAKAACSKLDTAGTACDKGSLKKRLARPPVCPSTLAEPVKGQQQRGGTRARLLRTGPVEKNGERHLDDVVCRGAHVTLRCKPAPLLSPDVKALASTPLQGTGGGRKWLRRAQCLEGDQGKSDTSTRGLSADEGKLAQGPQTKGQRAERAPKEACHMLEMSLKRNLARQHLGNMAVSHRAVRRTAVADLQDALL